MESILKLIASFLAVVVVLTLHEFAHAFVAYKCGDPTPKWNRRLTLNPARHFDLMGLIFFTLVGFGWAKPVPVNPDNFKKYRLGSALTASAGVIVNYLSAFLFCPLYILASYYFADSQTYFSYVLYVFTYCLFAYSLSSGVFTLLPLFPLDGFRLFEALNRKRGKVYRFLRQYGYYILMGLIIESYICKIFVDYLNVWQMGWFDILGYIMSFATNILGWPITALWGLVF